MASSLTTYPDHELNSFSFFTMEVTLTKNGYENWQKVVETVFDYTKNISEQKPETYFFDEDKLLGEIKFKFVEKQEAFDYVAKLSNTI